MASWEISIPCWKGLVIMTDQTTFMGELEKLMKNEFNGSDLIRLLIDFRALEQDKDTLNGLLKTIITNYALSEKKMFEMNKLKDRFLGMAAHDLRTPLVSIRGFSEMLLTEETGHLSAEQKRLIDIIYKASNDMLNLVNDLLDISAIESGRLDLVCDTVSLDQVVRERIILYHIIARKKNITLDFATEPLERVRMDTQKIIQVIDNLIGNAIKYSPEDATVAVRLRTESKLLYMDVHDQGMGIPVEEQAKLFGDFQRLSVKPTAGEKSTGLGLSIAKKIAQAHGGDIMVKSAPGKGSCFSLVLSYDPVRERPVSKTAEPLSDVSPSQNTSPQSKKRKLSVVLADDEPHIRLLMKGIIESMNAVVVGEAEQGEQVMDVVKEKKPDIVFLDINMPEKTGDEVLAEVMAYDAHAFVIMLTSVSDFETVSKCIELGASGYIRKDTPPKEMKQLIAQTWTDYQKRRRTSRG